MRNILVFLIMTIGLMPVTIVARADAISPIHENNLGVDQLNNEKAREAEVTFLRALTLDPFNAEIRYNLGTAYLAQKKFERALKEYQAVLRQPNLNPEIAFYANFNAAFAAQEQKQTDVALDFYQAALGIKPDSRETKVNIELLVQSAAGQQQQGQGQGQSQQPNEQKNEGQGEGQSQKNPSPSQENDQQNNKSKSSQNFSKEELKNIFEELERQEQKVRGLEYGTKGGREKGPDKDW